MTARALFACLLFLCVDCRAAEADDVQAIRQVALDYIEGWYQGDAQRMERALHPELAKRMVYTENGGSQLNHQSQSDLVEGTSRRPKRSDIAAMRRDVTILDRFQNAASVKVVAADWVDYLHVVKWNGSWKIINVLWELNPPPASAVPKPTRRPTTN